MTARYKTVALRLHQPDGDSEAFHDWEDPVGFIGGWKNPSLLLLGSVGFLDRWTVTVSRFSEALAIEGVDVLDLRFGLVPPREDAEGRKGVPRLEVRLSVSLHTKFSARSTRRR